MGTGTISGAGNMYSKPVMTGALAIKNSYAPKMSSCKNATKAKKKLNYNHREISGQITQAKKAQSASVVLTRAKSKLAVLQRCAGTGQYDSREVTNAIAHAKRMVRCAQLKVRNLKEEEQEQRAHDKKYSSEKQHRQGEIKRRVAKKERQLNQKVMLKESQEITKEKRRRNEIAQKRRRHRSQEIGKICEADMKYLKGQMENGDNSGNYSAVRPEATLDLSLEAAAMAEVQMLEEQIEAEAAAEVAAEMAMESSLSDLSGGMGMDAGMSTGGGGEAAPPAEAAAVDVSV